MELIDGNFDISEYYANCISVMDNDGESGRRFINAYIEALGLEGSYNWLGNSNTYLTNLSAVIQPAKIWVFEQEAIHDYFENYQTELPFYTISIHYYRKGFKVPNLEIYSLQFYTEIVSEQDWLNHLDFLLKSHPYYAQFKSGAFPIYKFYQVNREGGLKSFIGYYSHLYEYPRSIIDQAKTETNERID